MHAASPMLSEWVPQQGTLKIGGSLSGIGVHSGESIQVRILPADPHTGITFVRTDLLDAEILATWTNVSDTRFCTTLSDARGATVSTIEHLMAAFWTLGIDNARVEIDGPEVPILDGSAAPWIDLILSLGIASQGVMAPVVELLHTVRVTEGDSWLEVSPSSTFEVTLETPVGEGAVQKFSYTLGDFFSTNVGPARTFSRLQDVERMREMGLIRGGSLDNAVVFDGPRVLNPEGLRFEDECARHKVLDLIGDWSLGNRIYLAKIRGYATGHTLNHRLLKAVLSDASAWRFLPCGSGAREGTSPQAGAIAPLGTYRLARA